MSEAKLTGGCCVLCGCRVCLLQVALVCATVLLVSLGAGYYGNLVLGGIVGDFLGATIQVR